MKLYIIRHGETVWNIERRLQGKSDTPLNEKGIKLANITGQKMKDIVIDKVISSPLKRAMQTAECVMGERDIPIVTDERIAEISFGEWEGLSCKKENYELPSESFWDFFDDPFEFQPPEGGETVKEVCKRAEDFLLDLFERYGDQDINIMISTHGCLLRALMDHFYKSDSKHFWRGHVPPNCSVTIVEIKNDKATILEEDKVYYDPNDVVQYY